jgi:hypothetical protein
VLCRRDEFTNGMLVRRTEDIAIWADENCCLSSEEEIKATV